MKDKQIFAYLALSLLVGGFLGPFVIAVFGSRELALGFGMVAEILALIFGVLSYSEWIGKVVTVMSSVLVVAAALTTAVLIPIRARQQAELRAQSESQAVPVAGRLRTPSDVRTVFDGNVNHETISGTWNVVSTEIDGVPTETDVPKKITFQGSKLIAEDETSEGQSIATTFDFILDTSVVPTRLTCRNPTSRTICKYENGRLLLACFALPEAGFPSSLNDRRVGEGLVVQVLERPSADAGSKSGSNSQPGDKD